MVLESFKDPFAAVKKPSHMFFVGILYGTIAVFLSTWIFKQNSSLIMVFLTVLATVPLMYRTLKQQEAMDVKVKREKVILKNHARVLEFLVFLFLGILVAYSVLFIALPAEVVKNLFKVQVDTIVAINTQISGDIVSSSSFFSQIFFNNIKVLMFSVFFAFFYGAGAIFILTWNASVISAALGVFAKNKIAEALAALGSINAFNYFHFFSLGLLRYMVHGIPEIAAYFMGGLAGGIISVAMINHDLMTEKFRIIMLDALDLLVLAIFVLFIAALLEVFVTPVFFS